MITLDPRPGLPDAGVVRDIETSDLVVVQDPTAEHPYFRKPRLGTQVRVRKQGLITLQHVVRLAGGVDLLCPPSWVTVCSGGVVVPLRPATMALAPASAGSAR